MTTDAPFRDFPDPVPGDAAALDALYAAFADLRLPAVPFCEQCFPSGEGWRERILKPVPVRAADPKDFVAIYHEHIDCSVGEEGFLYFLPRMLETMLDLDVFPNMVERAIGAGLLDLAPHKVAAVAGAAAASLVNDVERDEVGPLEPCEAGSRVAEDHASLLVRLLIACRVEPRQIFERVVKAGGDRAAEALVEALDHAADPDDHKRDDLGYGRWLFEPVMRQAGTTQDTTVDVVRLLDDVAWIDFFDVVTPARFEALLSQRPACVRPLADGLREDYAAQRERVRPETRAAKARLVAFALGPAA